MLELLVNQPQGFCVCADVGFPYTEELFGKIIVSGKEGALDTTSRLAEYTNISIKRAISGIRQPAEWGMRAVQGSFPRLKLNLTVDKLKRKHILETAFKLFNFKTRNGSPNQIAAFFDDPDKQWRNFTNNSDSVAEFYKLD